MATLSSSEAQRLRLWRAAHIELTGALYLFDEPTASLHPADIDAFLPRLLALRNAGNTVVAIDHHPALWKIADHLIDIGPDAGEDGGRILYQGPPSGLKDTEDSATAAWFDEADEPSPRRVTAHGELRLLDPDLTFPLGVLCLVSGPSGVGKTRLLRDVLIPAIATRTNIRGADKIEEAVLFDQTPLPRSSRSNPATALKIFDDIRDLFAETTDARIHNHGPGAFSFNQPGGRCETCEGQGKLTVDMQFLADVTTTCPECLGRRYRREILAIKVRGLDIAEVLALTVREAFRFFRVHRAIEKKLKRLLDVGLDYLALGQSLDTLSAGEMQRLKLAAHLAKSRKPRSLFVLIEPTRGLHPRDVAGLIECFRELVATGHSLLIEDPNPWLRQAADTIVEIALPQ